MNISILGTGNMASGLAGLLGRAGYNVTIGARDTQKARNLVASLPGNIAASDMATAATKADVVVLALPYDAVATVLADIGDVSGKILIDITNPLTPDYMGLTIGHQTSAAEEIQKLAAKAHVVKAFNTIFAQVLQSGGKVSGAGATVFIAGDDDASNDTVAAIVTKIGLLPLKTGGLIRARYLEPVAGLNIALGYGVGLGTGIAPTWVGLT